MNLCACGCQAEVTPPRRYISGHNLRNLKRTAQHRARIAEAQRRAWATKRQRHPVGSTNLDAHGYVRVKVLEGSGRWEKQHKLVMEAALGRKLNPGEQVHHINGVRSDNRLENLYLCASAADHNAVEHSMAVVFRELMAAGYAQFNRETGRYEHLLLR